MTRTDMPPRREGLPGGTTTLRVWAARHGRAHDYARHWRKRPGFPEPSGSLPPTGRHGGGIGEPYYDEVALDAWLADQPDLAPPERINPAAVPVGLSEQITLGRFAGIIGAARGTVHQHRGREGFPKPGPDGRYLAGDLLAYWNSRPGRRGRARSRGGTRTP